MSASRRTESLRAKLALAALGAVVSAAGCRAFSARADYASYRAYRYQPAGPQRLAAGSRYLGEHPQGHFRAEVAREVLGAEEDFWAEHRASAEGLSEYITAFPGGSHIEEARQRLGVFEGARQQQEDERRRHEVEERQRRAEELRAQGARARVWGRITFDRWARVFGGLQGWGGGMGAIVQANPDFGAAFENAPPQCRGSHCRKEYFQDFSLPIPGRTAVPRRLTFQLDMVRSGQAREVHQVMLLLRNRGLSTWAEAERNAAIDPGDAQGREQGVRWAMDQLRALVSAGLAEPRETPASLYGPPPEPVVVGAEEEAEEAPVAPTDPNACVIPSQPLGTRWSVIVGCPGVTGARPFTVTDALRDAHEEAMAPAGPIAPAITPHACLRVDAFAALDGEGMSTDEGLAITMIPPCALQPTRPGARPAAPARPAATARPGAARPAAPAAPTAPAAPAAPPAPAAPAPAEAAPPAAPTPG